jgi:hypothetical protein
MPQPHLPILRLRRCDRAFRWWVDSQRRTVASWFETHGLAALLTMQYVGAVHTNTIEGFWSIFKRGIVGTFHNVSKKYLHLYVAEFQSGYNNRFNDDIFGTAIAGA